MSGRNNRNDKRPNKDDSFPTVSSPGSHIGGVEQTGEQIGPYKLLSVLGEGGCGIVYLAEQKRPVRRRVALKIIKPGMDSKQVIARFEAERQALALLDHPSIAKMYNAGTTKYGRPYFVMEYVKGRSITEHCDYFKLTIEDRLNLFLRVCDAIQYAHQKGIIHRDIKPSNILVSVQNKKTVFLKVIDFGVAKALNQQLTERTLFTEQGQLVGTPEYMSPEQAEINAQDIDIRSDIYSLGILLYEILTGALPFERTTLRKAAFSEIQRIIKQKDPPRPSTRLSSLGDIGREVARNRNTEILSLVKRLSKELEWIPLKAIRKDPRERYRTVAEFADDIQNYLNGNPLIAGPESIVYRFKKFVRRNRGLVAAVTSVLISLLLGAIISAIFAIGQHHARIEAERAQHEAERARYTAEEARAQAENAQEIAQEERKKQEKEANRARIAQDIAERQAYCATIQSIYAKIKAEDYRDTRTMLEETDPDLRGWEWGYLKNLLQYPDWSIQANAQYDYCVPSLAVSRDGKYFITRIGDTLKLWNRNDQKLLWEKRFTVEPVYPTKRVFDPKGRFFVAMFGKKIFICKIDNGEPFHTISGDSGYQTICIHPDGSKLYIGTQDGRVLLYDIENRMIQKSFKINDHPVSYLAMGSEGKLLASATYLHVDLGAPESQVLIHDPMTLSILYRKKTRQHIRGFAYAENREALAVVENDRLNIYSSDLSHLVTQPIRHDETPTHLCLSADERYIIVGGGDGLVNIYDTISWELMTTVHHDSMIIGAEYLSDSKILTAGGDGTVKQWSRPEELNPSLFLENPDKTGNYIIEYRSDGQVVAKSGWYYDRFPLFDIKNKRVNYLDVNGVEKISGRTRIIRFRPKSSQIILQTPGWIHFFDTKTEDYAEVNKIPVPDELYDAAFDSTGNFLVVSYVSGGVDIINLKTGKFREIEFPGKKVVMSKLLFSNDGKTLAVWEESDNGRIILIDLDANKIMWELGTGGSGFHGLGFHPDGEIIAFGSGEGGIVLRYVKSGDFLKNIYGHRYGCVSSVKFSPDGSRLLSSCSDDTIRVWDWRLGKETIVFNEHEYPLHVSFSPDGMSIANYCSVRIALPWTKNKLEDFLPEAKAFNGHHYVLYQKSMNWKAAKSYCESIGAHLATITNKAEMAWIRKTFDFQSGCWLGGTDEEQEGVWIWVTGEKWQYSFWGEGEPNNYRGIECALEMQESGHWNDNDMEKLNYFLIEWDR